MREVLVKTLQPVINFDELLVNGITTHKARSNTEKVTVTKIKYERALPKIFIEKDENLMN
jgi:hypothetical protein